MDERNILEAMHPWPLFRPASRGRRWMGLGLDLALLAGSALVLGLLEALWLSRGQGGGASWGALTRQPGIFAGGMVLWAVCVGVVWWSYFVLLRAACRRTCGEAIWGLRLVRWDGGDPGVGRCLSRGLGAMVSLLPLAAGFYWSFLGRQKRSWHDRLSGTLLVESWPPRFCP